VRDTAGLNESEVMTGPSPSTHDRRTRRHWRRVRDGASRRALSRVPLILESENGVCDLGLAAKATELAIADVNTTLDDDSTSIANRGGDTHTLWVPARRLRFNARSVTSFMDPNSFRP
jgi:hypothetical protein